MPPNPTELRQFMDAIAAVESRGSGDYLAVGEDRGSQYGVAQGRYQIMSDKILPAWAAEAGYAGITVQQFLNSPKAQDDIAGSKMAQYYDMYGGSWELVAAAWFGGTGAASKAMKEGWGATAGINDSGNTNKPSLNIPGYVQKVVKNMGATNASSLQQANPSIGTEERADIQTNQAQATINPETVQSPQRQLAQSVMGRLSDMLAASPDNPELHSAVRLAMRPYVGVDQPMDLSPNDPPAPPTESPDFGQSGVR